jgi:hypothetical protein
MSNPSDFNQLIEFVPNEIWYKRIPLSYLGVPIGTRMTIIRINSDSLFIHSPVRLDEATRLELSKLGRVDFVVSPNNMHHLFIGDYFDAYPSAKIYASPGLPEKRKDLNFKYKLHDIPEPEWIEHIDQMLFQGHPLLREVVFLHKRSGTLLVADLIVNFQADSHPITRMVTKIGGIYQRPTPPIDYQLPEEDMVKTKSSIERLLKWDFDRIILAHGSIIESNGKDVIRQAFNWVLNK